MNIQFEASYNILQDYAIIAKVTILATGEIFVK